MTMRERVRRLITLGEIKGEVWHRVAVDPTEPWDYEVPKGATAVLVRLHGPAQVRADGPKDLLACENPEWQAHYGPGGLFACQRR